MARIGKRAAKMSRAATLVALPATAVGVLLGVLVGVAVGATPTPTATPTPSDPTEQEKTIFTDKLTRLQNNADLMPRRVADAIASLSRTVTKRITCPRETKFTSVTINVTTKLVHWDPTLAVPNTVGTYGWDC
jgi:hypothetical protein